MSDSEGIAIVETVRTSSKNAKVILNPMKVKFPVGSVTAILGPSGSGKTTLLEFVTGNMPTGVTARGEVNIDGPLALVPQDDVLHGFYTCQTYLEHYTRLSGQKVNAHSLANIDNLLSSLGLTESKDVRVGDIFLKGLSGGQKRRLSVALEANSNPRNFVLDEPTSGLDSESAYQLIKFLKEYAQGGDGRRVILTIHQPSSFLWEMIDNVVLLSKGKLIYQGPRSEIESFFAFAGYPTPENYNPADHYVTAANDSFQTDKVKKTVDEWAGDFVQWAEGDLESSRKTKVPAGNSQPSPVLRRRSSLIRSATSREGGVVTAIELTRRYFFNLWFNPGMLAVRVFMYSVLALMLGALFWDLGSKRTYGSVQSRIALLFYVVAFFVFMSVAVLPFTVSEKSIVDKEVRNGYYHPAVYQLAQAVSTIPGVAILSGLGTAIILLMTGMNSPWWYFLNLFLALFCAEALAQLVSHVVPHFIIGMAGIAGLYGMFMLLQGFMLIPSEFPGWLKWAHYIAFHTYSWRTFMYKEFGGDDLKFDSVQFPNGTAVLEAYEIEKVNPTNDMIVLFVYGNVLHLISFIVLHVKFVLYKKRNVA